MAVSKIKKSVSKKTAVKKTIKKTVTKKITKKTPSKKTVKSQRTKVICISHKEDADGILNKRQAYLDWLEAMKVPDVDALGRMLTRLERRGPDHEGRYVRGAVALGHRRLSVIDLSPASNQPWVDETLGLALVFNGAIYNYNSEPRFVNCSFISNHSDAGDRTDRRAVEIDEHHRIR